MRSPKTNRFLPRAVLSVGILTLGFVSTLSSIPGINGGVLGASVVKSTGSSNLILGMGFKGATDYILLPHVLSVVPTFTPAPKAIGKAPYGIKAAGPRIVRPAPRPPVSVVVSPIRKVSPAPISYRNYIKSANGKIHTSVGFYSDCTTKTLVPRGYAAIYTCVPYILYILGHNPGVFTSLLSMGNGSIINYWDNQGVLHVYQIFAERDFNKRNQPRLPSPLAGAGVEFQACITPDAMHYRVFDARQIN